MINQISLQETSKSSEKRPTDDDIDWHIMVVFVSGCAGLCFIFGYAVYRKLRKHRYANQSNSRGNNVPTSNGSLQFSPSEINLASGECIENLTISKEHHLSSKCHNRTEVLSSNRCLQEKGCSISQDADDTSNTSENVYSHLNMDVLSYNTLNHTSESENGSNIGMYSISSQEVTPIVNNIYNKTATKCTSRRSFLYPEDFLPKGDEYSPTNDGVEKINNSTLNKVSDVAKSNIQNPDNLSASVTRKVKKSKKERLAKKIHMDEMSKMLENFKPQNEEVGNSNTKANMINRQRSSKKTKKKVLRYSFAPSTEIA